MTRMLGVCVWTACLTTGALFGVKARASGAQPGVIRTFVVPAAPGARADLPAARLELEVEPRAVREDGRGELLELEVALHSNFGRDAIARYGYQVVTDDGRIVAEAKLSPLARLGANARSKSSIATPSGLPDGFYQVRVMAVASDATDEILVGADRYFRVDDGALSPLSASEWFATSNANRAHRKEVQP